MRNRREQYNMAIRIKQLLIGDAKSVILHAEEKTGKRTIKEILSVLDWDNQNISHMYFTSLNRKDIKEQLDELEDFKIYSKIIYNKHKAEEYILHVREKIARGRSVIIHWDECDYGSGTGQSLKPLLDYCNRKRRVKIISYSATEEEAKFARHVMDEANLKYEYLRFIPSVDYRGSHWFLNNQIDGQPIVLDCQQFFNYNTICSEERIRFSSQGNSMLGSMTNNTNIGILRVCGSKKFGEESIALYPKFKELVETPRYYNFFTTQGFKFIFINKDHSLKWNDENEIRRCIDPNMKNIFVVNMTCSRSTELCSFLKRKLAFFHDARKLENSNYNTLSQAYGRIKHYKYGNDGREILWKAKICIDKQIFEANCNENCLLQLKNIASRVNGRKEPSVIADTHQCENKEECIMYIRDNWNPNYNFPVNYDLDHINNDGLYEAIKRSIKRVYNIQEILNDNNTMINETTKYRIYPCYNNRNELVWIIAYFVRRDTENRVYQHKTSDRSIHY